MFETVGALGRFFDVIILITPLIIMAIMVIVLLYLQKRRFIKRLGPLLFYRDNV